MAALKQWFTLMVSQWLLLWPWLLLGVTTATAARYVTPRNWWTQRLPKDAWGQMFWGLGLGLLLPLGQVGALPMMRRLFWQTGSGCFAIAFWLTAASLNPINLLQFANQLPGRGGLIFTYSGLSLAIILAIASLFTFERQQRQMTGDLEAPFPYPAIARASAHTHNPEIPSSAKLSRVSQGMAIADSLGQSLVEWSAWLLMACGLLALGQLLLPIEQLLSYGVDGLLIGGILYGLQPSQMASLMDLLLGRYGLGTTLGFLLTGSFFSGMSLILLINAVSWRAYGYLVLLLGAMVTLMALWLNFQIF